MTAEGDALVAALGRFADILRRGDSASAETVDINENANDGNEPAGQERVVSAAIDSLMGKCSHA